MKKELFWIVKKYLNRRGYDIKYYHPHLDTLLKNLDVQIVLDIGANDGQFAEDIHTRLPKAYIYSFEPLKDCFEKLNIRMKEAAHFKSFNIALGDSEGAMEINRNSFSPSSSILPMDELHKKLYPKSAESRKETIRIKKLDSFSHELILNKAYLVKLDVQGYEDKAIKGGSEIIKNASLVLVETSFKTLYKGQPLFDDIYTLMKNLGFSYYGNHGQHWNMKTNELIYEDALFVKTKFLQ